MKSYLKDRLHMVKIGSTTSNFLTLNIGVPQGSVLGPLLFLLYINDMPKSTKFYVKLFADDTFLSYSSDNYEDLQRKVNEELININNWLKNNKLTLNISKTKYMIITNRKKPPHSEFKIKVANTEIKKCIFYKYLGVLLDETLSWKPHIDYICRKISRMCGIFSKLRYATNFPLLIQVYHALVASHLQYCNLVWGNASETILSPLKKMQNRIIRIISFSPYNCHNVHELYEDLQLLNLDQIHKMAKAKFMFKYENGKLPSNFDNYLVKVSDVHSYNLRSTSAGKYMKVWGRTKHSLKILQYDAVKVWENVPSEIKENRSIIKQVL